MNLNLNKSLGIVAVFIGAILALGLFAAFSPTIFANTKAVGENLTSADVGNTQANGIVHIFGFIVPLVLALGFVGLLVGGGIWAYGKVKG